MLKNGAKVHVDFEPCVAYESAAYKRKGVQKLQMLTLFTNDVIRISLASAYLKLFKEFITGSQTL